MLFELFGYDPDDTKIGTFHWHDMVEGGLPEQVLENLACLLEIDPGVVHNWIQGDGQSYPSSRSLMRICLGVSFLFAAYKNNSDHALKWLNKPQKELGGQIPMSLLLTDIGYTEFYSAVQDVMKQNTLVEEPVQQSVVEEENEEYTNASLPGNEDENSDDEDNYFDNPDDHAEVEDDS